MDMQPQFMDMDGNPMSLLAWIELFENTEARTLADEVIVTGAGPVRIVTMWFGAAGPGERRIFGTAIRHQQYGLAAEIRVYDTREEALNGHREVIARLIADCQG
jgi:hypothetical protein